MEEFVNICIEGVRCPKCRRWGSIMPGKAYKVGNATIKYWICGGSQKKKGCNGCITQARVMIRCMNAGKKYTKELCLPENMMSKLNEIEINLYKKEPEKKIEAHANLATPIKKTETREIVTETKVTQKKVVTTPKLQPKREQVNAPKPAFTKTVTNEGKHEESLKKMCLDPIEIVKDPNASRNQILQGEECP